MTPILFRPHHVLCSIGFQSEGYSDAFVANMGHFVDGRLRAPGGRSVTLRITHGADAICAPCPHRQGLGCEKNDLIAGLDMRHGAALGLQGGQEISWGACLDRVVERVEPEDLDTLCTGCSWLSLGMCKSAVKRLIEKEKGRP